MLLGGAIGALAGNQPGQPPTPDSKPFDWQAQHRSIPVPQHLPTHPLAALHGRVHHSFEVLPVQQSRLRFNYSLGNVWLPGVSIYQPLDPSTAQELEGIEWQLRQYSFNPDSEPNDSYYFAADGVLRQFNLSYETALRKGPLGASRTRWELRTHATMLLLDPGKAPSALLNSDDFIEWFHSNVRGPEDPFARRAMSMNEAGILYRDAKGYELEMQSGDVWLSTAQADLRYYWGGASARQTQWFGTFGLHPALRAGYGQFGADVGISTSIMRAIPLSSGPDNTGRRLILGAAGDVVRHNLLERSQNVDISTRSSLMSAEINLSYEGKKRPGYQMAYGINYRCNESLHNNAETTGQVLAAPFTSYHWHHAGAHLFHNSHGWTFYMAYQRKRFNASVYVREDFPIDNAPDLQTGLELIYHLKAGRMTR